MKALLVPETSSWASKSLVTTFVTPPVGGGTQRRRRTLVALFPLIPPVPCGRRGATGPGGSKGNWSTMGLRPRMGNRRLLPGTKALVDGEPACRRDSVRPLRDGVAIHLSGLPGGGARCRAPDGPPAPPVRPCSGWGLPSRPGHPGRWCALTAPFHPYLCAPLRLRHRRSVLCGTVLQVTPTGR